MAKVHRIHSMPDDSPWDGGLPPQGSAEHPAAIRALDGVLRVQRPVVVAHLRSIRLRHPNTSTADIVRMLERRYLAAVTTGGAAVGATAVVPGIGTGVTRSAYWGETITKSLPRAAVGPLLDRLKGAFIHQFAAKGSASVIGKALPFGIGAAIGGTGNHLLGRRVVIGSRKAFGVVPVQYPTELEPRPGASRLEAAAFGTARRVGAAIGAGGRRTIAAVRPKRGVEKESAPPEQ